MIIKSINLILIIGVIVTAFMLVTQRFSARLDYDKLAQLEKAADTLNKDYSKLQIEVGTFSSSLVLQDFAYNKLGLVRPDPKHIVKIK